MHSFNPEEIHEIEGRGSSISDIQDQVEILKKGFNYITLLKPATIGDGIISFTEDEISELIEKYDSQKRYHSIVKFVPASGAASRMFKHLFEYQNFDKKDESVDQFFEKMNSLAFFKGLEFQDRKKLQAALDEKDFKGILKKLLHEAHLNYGQLPKGLIPFHSSNDKVRTAFQEHFIEGLSYASNGQGSIKINFTISKEHQEKFESHLNSFIDQFEKIYECEFDVTFSYQEPSTDTIAVDQHNEPVKKSSGQFLFRPGGHGALIQNLNQLDADIIFIKNIDNVLPDTYKGDTIKYKKVLAAKLIDLQAYIFHYLEKMNSEVINDDLISEIEKFCAEELSMDFPETYQNCSAKEKREWLKKGLNKPIRVCGMVKNTGEPGGGPFWIKGVEGLTSLQIVESAQVNLSDESQNNILKRATHFNPVDLVCATKDYLGEPFDLTEFIDKESYFISKKSHEGKSIKALEHPGLWNGAMANWITIFVEVPITTFSPVKTINDLLKTEHQG